MVQNENGRVWRCIGIYGNPESTQKHHTWTLLKRLAALSSHPWCCFGDFNEILYLHEKKVGNDRNRNVIADFREAVQACNLVDIGYHGYPYTWSNRRFGPHHIEERLDRFLCSKDWCDSFQASTAINLVNWISDHCPVVFYCNERGRNRSWRKQHPTREHYEDM